MQDHLLASHRYHFTVFFSNAAAASLWVIQARRCNGCDAFSMCVRQMVLPNRLDCLFLCASGLVGVAAGCLVLRQGSVELVQVARSVGPLFTSGWAYLILSQATTGVPMMCLLATLAGTTLASWNEPTFCAATFALIFIINATLTYRNTVTKR